MTLARQPTPAAKGWKDISHQITSRQAKAAHATRAWQKYEQALLAKHPDCIGTGTAKRSQGGYALAVYVSDPATISEELRGDVVVEFRPRFRTIPVEIVAVGTITPL